MGPNSRICFITGKGLVHLFFSKLKNKQELQVSDKNKCLLGIDCIKISAADSCIFPVSNACKCIIF